MQTRFPSDARNRTAAERLAQLAEEVVNLTDDQWAQLQPFFGWASEPWQEAMSQAGRHVEFKPHVRTLQGFMNDVVAIFAEQRATAA